MAANTLNKVIFSPRARQLTQGQASRLVAGLSLLIAAVPFHAFVVTVLGAQFGHQLVWASWKEVLQLWLLVGVGAIALTHRRWAWLNRGANRAIMIALVFAVLASWVGQSFATGLSLSWLVGVKTTVLPLVLFIVVQPLAEYFSDRRLALLVLVPAVIVAGLAVIQFVLVPTEILTALGYGASTILPYQGVHPGFEAARAFSTLGGPNQLGAYLIIPAVWLLSRSISDIKPGHRVASGAGFLLVLFGIAVSFSRSALIGLAVGLVVLIALYLPARWRWTVVVGAALAGWLAWLLIVDIVQAGASTPWSSFFLRGSLSATGIVGGDAGHIQSIDRGLRAVLDHPFGLGLGSAGPASFYQAQPFLTENWWLQIGVELGIPGLLAVLASWGYMLRHWYRHLDHLDMVMFASFCGLGVASLFLHTFADSTLSIMAFALAGLIYGRHWPSRRSGSQS